MYSAACERVAVFPLVTAVVVPPVFAVLSSGSVVVKPLTWNTTACIAHVADLFIVIDGVVAPVTLYAYQIETYEAAPPPIKPEAAVILANVIPVAVTEEILSAFVFPIMATITMSPVTVFDVVVITRAVVDVFAPDFV
jgi:hypothetical protein